MGDRYKMNKISFIDCSRGLGNPACGLMELGAFESNLPSEDIVDPQEGLDRAFD